MDVRRALAFLLLLTCILGTVSSVKNGRGSPNFNRRSRRIALNEFLVPPPPPRPHSVRTGKVANPRPTEQPGYFARLMGWLNPFNYGASPTPSPLPPSLPNTDSPYPHSPKLLPPAPALGPVAPPLGPPPGPHLNPPPGASLGPSPGSSAQVYTGVPPPIYNKPSLNNQNGYLPPNKERNCNPCNKVPWIPMPQSGHPGDQSFVPPLPPLPPLGGNTGGGGAYLPPIDSQLNHDQHAGHSVPTSQEIRPPDFSYQPPLPIGQNGQTAPLFGLLPNPHLYPGPMPPLFKATPFDHPPRSSGADVGYLDQIAPIGVESAPSPVHLPSNDSLLDIDNQNFDAHQSGQANYFDPKNNQGYGNEENNQAFGQFGQEYNQPGQSSDLSSGGFDGTHQAPQDHGFIHTINNQHTSDSNVNQQFSNTGILDHHNFANSDTGNNQGYQGSNNQGIDIFGSVPTSTENDFSLPLNHQGFSNSNGLDHRGYSNDLSSSGSAIKDSHASLETTVATFSNENLIHVEQSPLLDLSKEETDTDSSASSSHSNSFVESLEETAKTTVNYEPETSNAFQNQQELGTQTTETYLGSDRFQSINDAVETPSPLAGTTYFVYPTGSDEVTSVEDRKINGSLQNSNQAVHDPRNIRGHDVSYIPPSGQPGYLWSVTASTTPQPNKDISFLNALLNSYDESSKEISDKSVQYSSSSIESVEANIKEAIKMSQRQQGAKRNKQVQLIIPYTSQYTPVPFQQPERTQPRKVSFGDKFNRDNYIGQESRNEVKIGSTSNQFNAFDSRGSIQTTTMIPTTKNDRSILIDRLNNSIDVHRLQKNIDNWTIQEYSRGTTSSTVLPSSSRPYLLPSKKIPDEYFTTTEPAVSNNREENVKTYALAGFSFNDLDHEGSASDRVEQSHIQVVHVKDFNKNTTTKKPETNTTSIVGKEEVWKGFSVSISPLNKERVYVVTPQPIPSKTGSKLNREEERKSITSKVSRKPSEVDLKKAKNKTNNFESIERAYQVLPQAVNNLAVAATAPESIPLWGIMEHEEFATLGLDNRDDEEDPEHAPVLYTGHSKVTKARR